jgi:hypothetical protein
MPLKEIANFKYTSFYEDQLNLIVFIDGLKVNKNKKFKFKILITKLDVYFVVMALLFLSVIPMITYN